MTEDDRGPCVFCYKPVEADEGGRTVTNQSAVVRFHDRCRAEYDLQRREEAE